MYIYVWGNGNSWPISYVTSPDPGLSPEERLRRSRPGAAIRHVETTCVTRLPKSGWRFPQMVGNYRKTIGKWENPWKNP